MNGSSSESSLEHRSFKSVINLYEAQQESCAETEKSEVVSSGHNTTQIIRPVAFGDQNFKVADNDSRLNSTMKSISGGSSDIHSVTTLSELTNEDNK